MLIDQRLKKDYNKGHIFGAVNIEMQKDIITDEITDIHKLVKIAQKNKVVYIYCYGGTCAKNTVRTLKKEYNIKNVINIGGYKDLVELNDAT